MALGKTISLTLTDEFGASYNIPKQAITNETALCFDANGNPVFLNRAGLLETLSFGRFTNISQWDALPVITAVTAASDKFFLLSGANTPVASRATKGGLLLTTGATDTNGGIVIALTGTSFRPAISTTNLVSCVGRFSLANITTLFFNFGLDQAPSSTDPSVITGTDFARIIFDPTNALTSGITTNFIAVVRGASGTVTYYDTGVPVVINTDFKLRIDVGADLKPLYYINNALVATSTIAMAATTQIAHFGLSTISGSATKAIECRYVRIGREMA